MIPGRHALAFAAATVLVSAAVMAQQQPIHGCNAAASCRPLGFSTLDRDAGLGGSLFGFGMRFGPGFSFYLAASQKIGLAPGPEPSPTAGGDFFHLHASLLPPNPAPTPVPTPTQPASPSTKAER